MASLEESEGAVAAGPALVGRAASVSADLCMSMTPIATPASRSRALSHRRLDRFAMAEASSVPPPEHRER